MTTFILLLRGVTPSGKNKVPMSQLREALEDAGFTRVRTYIQSGNVLVDTGLTAHEVEERVHDIIKNHIGADLAVIARTGQQLEEALEGNPFSEGYDISRVFFVSFAEQPPADKIAELLSRDISPEKIAFGKIAAYMYIPGPYGKGTLSGNFLEKKLGVAATMRSFNTVKALAAMSRQEPERPE
jgi:uncharacterized protein (DUF1697 family)